MLNGFIVPNGLYCSPTHEIYVAASTSNASEHAGDLKLSVKYLIIRSDPGPKFPCRLKVSRCLNPWDDSFLFS
jgi:hypothetical protein